MSSRSLLRGIRRSTHRMPCTFLDNSHQVPFALAIVSMIRIHPFSNILSASSIPCYSFPKEAHSKASSEAETFNLRRPPFTASRSTQSVPPGTRWQVSRQHNLGFPVAITVLVAYSSVSACATEFSSAIAAPQENFPLLCSRIAEPHIRTPCFELLVQRWDAGDSLRCECTSRSKEPRGRLRGRNR